MTRRASDDVLRAVIATQNEIVSAAREFDGALELVCERAKELTGATGAAVGLANGNGTNGDGLVCRAGAGSAVHWVGERLAAEAGVRAGLGSVAGAPLHRGRTTVGVLEIHAEVASAFGEEATETLELLAGVLSAHLTGAARREAAAVDSRRDALTGLGNRLDYEERLKADIAHASRHRHPLSLCVIDIDAFRALNDRYGNMAGNEALRRVARALQDLREGDQAFRLQDDDFALLLPYTDADGAAALALRLRIRLSRAFPNAPGIGVSVGIAELAGHIPGELHAEATAALLEIKQQSRVAVRV